MAVVQDWALAAAMEARSLPNRPTIEEIRTVIVKHCPMLPDTAYIPIPRCETCANWIVARHRDFGTCKKVIELDGNLIPKDFGCVRWDPKT